MRPIPPATPYALHLRVAKRLRVAHARLPWMMDRGEPRRVCIGYK